MGSKTLEICEGVAIPGGHSLPFPFRSRPLVALTFRLFSRRSIGEGTAGRGGRKVPGRKELGRRLVVSWRLVLAGGWLAGLACEWSFVICSPGMGAAWLINRGGELKSPSCRVLWDSELRRGGVPVGGGIVRQNARVLGELANNSNICAASGDAAASSGEKRVAKKSGWDFCASAAHWCDSTKLRKSRSAEMAVAFGTVCTYANGGPEWDNLIGGARCYSELPFLSGIQHDRQADGRASVGVSVRRRLRRSGMLLRRMRPKRVARVCFLASNDVTTGTLLGKVVKPEQGGAKYEPAHHDTYKNEHKPLPNRIGQIAYAGNQVKKAES